MLSRLVGYFGPALIDQSGGRELAKYDAFLENYFQQMHADQGGTSGQFSVLSKGHKKKANGKDLEKFYNAAFLGRIVEDIKRFSKLQDFPAGTLNPQQLAAKLDAEWLNNEDKYIEQFIVPMAEVSGIFSDLKATDPRDGSKEKTKIENARDAINGLRDSFVASWPVPTPDQAAIIANLDTIVAGLNGSLASPTLSSVPPVLNATDLADIQQEFNNFLVLGKDKTKPFFDRIKNMYSVAGIADDDDRVLYIKEILGNFGKIESPLPTGGELKNYLDGLKAVGKNKGVTDQILNAIDIDQNGLGPDGLEELYKDFWAAFESMRSDKDLPSKEKEKAFFDKYKGLFPEKTVDDETKNGQADILTYLRDPDIKRYFQSDWNWKNSYEKVISALEKGKINSVSEELKELLDVADSMGFATPFPFASFPGLTAPNIERFIAEKLDVKDNPDPLKIDKFKKEYSAVFKDIYDTKDVAEYLNGIDSTRGIVRNMNFAKSKIKWDEVPTKIEDYEGKWKKRKKKINEKLNETILKPFSRHKNHIYKSKSAESIVNALWKKGINPSKGLGAWLEKKDDIKKSVDSAHHGHFDKLVKFLETLKSDAKDLFENGLSDPNKMNAIAAEVINQAVDGKLKKDEAQAILESIAVMRYSLFTSDRREEFRKGLKDSNIIANLPFLQGHEGTKIFGKVVDRGLKLSLSMMFEAGVFGKNVINRIKSKKLKEGKKRVDAKTKELDKLQKTNPTKAEEGKKLQNELWAFWKNAMSYETYDFNVLQKHSEIQKAFYASNGL